MRRKCPRCGHFKTRRSAVRTHELESSRHVFLSPYRCRDCQHRFWVVSRSAYFMAAVVGAALVTGTVTWNVQELLSRSEPVGPTQTTGNFAAAIKRAQTNDPDAQYEVALMYSTGDGIAKNEPEARKWLERAAEQGHAGAEYELGNVLREGRGAVQDYERAAKWTQRAAERGHARAQLALGMMYRTGAGVPADSVKAYTWLNLAAAHGVSEAVVVRDAVLSRLSQQEIVDAQAEARRLSQDLPAPPTPTPR
jgi:TPR repeat protein